MICYNSILNRDDIKQDIINKLLHFQNNKHMKNIKRGFYISGDCGIGKTEFVKKILKELDYDIVHYSACDIRNKSVIENMDTSNMSDKCVISMFNKKKRNIAIIMDEIDGLNSGDKGGITTLINIIRPKKTKKQMLELITNNPIFCISTNEIDKKIKELIKVCHYYEFKMPNEIQLKNIIDTTFMYENDIIKKAIFEYSQYDLRKINIIISIYNKNKIIMYDILNSKCLIKKSIIEISKDIVKTIYKNNISLDKHNIYINENDRTIVALLWHENICDVLSNNNFKNLQFYYKLLQNMCYGDYIDRITFQKQIWQFNELSSIIKIMYNNYLLHNDYDNQTKKVNEVRFTKVLTKYSTEFNNYTFFQKISNMLTLDKKDILSYFMYLNNNNHEEHNIYNNYEINQLDINRIYRYINYHVEFNL